LYSVGSVIHPSGEQYEIAHGGQRAVIVEVGGGLRRYAVGDRDVLDGYGVDEMCHSARGQVLAPWPNRIEEGAYEFDGQKLQLPLTEPEARNAIHGLVRFMPWRAVEHHADRVLLELLLHPQPGFPFTLLLRIEYRLGDAGLQVRTTAENVGATACPFGLGHHPYLAAPTGKVDDVTYQLPGREPQRVGEATLDDTFGDLERDADGVARVRVDDTTVWLDAAYRYVLLFTGDLPDVGRRSLAVEPMTCPRNAFRTGEALLRLEPGDRFEGRWGIAPGGG
jgi:aldose 1-epimerase